MKLYHVPYEEIAAIEWDGNGTTYDVNLFNLGVVHDQFIVRNPWTEHKDVYRYINYIPETN
jgi:hypothetical protein